MQNVIAARDFDLYISFDIIETPFKIGTGSSFSASITGSTEDIGAFSTDEPIGVDNAGTSYDISFSLQEAEAQRIKDALALKSGGKIAHIRQIIESATITAVWHKRRDVPASTTTETYTRCTGIEEGSSVERRSTETLKSWSFRARGMSRTTVEL